MDSTTPRPDPQRRRTIKKLAYVAPAVLSLQAAPKYAKAGSVKLPPKNSGPPSWVPGPPPWVPGPPRK